MSVSPGKRWYEVLSGEPVEGDPDGLRDPINVEGYEWLAPSEVEAKMQEFGEWAGRPHVALPVDAPPLEWLERKIEATAAELRRIIEWDMVLLRTALSHPDHSRDPDES